MTSLERKLDVRLAEDVFRHRGVHDRKQIAQASVVALGNYRRAKMHIIQQNGVITFLSSDVKYGARKLRT